MGAYMEMIYIDSDNHARHTNVGATMNTDEKTIAAFESVRALEIPISKAKFLCDLYDDSGDLVETVALDRKGFTAISGETVLTEAEYRKIDHNYWAEAARLSRM